MQRVEMTDENQAVYESWRDLMLRSSGCVCRSCFASYAAWLIGRALNGGDHAD